MALSYAPHEHVYNPLLLDSYRHRQVGARTVDDTQSAAAPSAAPDTAALQATRALGMSVPSGAEIMVPLSALTTLSSAEAEVPSYILSTADVQQDGMHEMSERRVAAVKRIFHRLDHGGQGSVALDKIEKELERVSDLDAREQNRLLHSFTGNTGHSGRARRVSYADFAEYYRAVSKRIPRSCDFEKVLRKHWGFTEISEILEDMKNQLAQVGIACAFRQILQRPGSDMSLSDFEQGFAGVNITYRPQDLKRVFDAFQQSSSGTTGGKVAVTGFSETMTEGPRPDTPTKRRPGAKPAQSGSDPLSASTHTAHGGYGGMNGYAASHTASTHYGSSLHSGASLTTASYGGSYPNAGLPPAPLAAPPQLQEQAKPTAVQAAPAGRKWAVTVGINYLNMPAGGGRLSGCINDSDTFIEILSQKFGFKTSEIRQLRDDDRHKMPTKRNILAALNWLTEGASSGDHLFVHYSGHGSQRTDRDGDELDGRDETLVPCDFRHGGMISDDELRQTLVLPLKRGVRLTCIFDCCHSGTVLDLPFKVTLSPDGHDCEVKRKKSSCIKGSSEADVVMISGCKDNQTSADIGAGSAGNDGAAGAMTTSFKTVIEKDITVSMCKLIMEMRHFLKVHRFQQLPQLMSEQFVNLTDCFIPEAEKDEDAPPPSLRPPTRRAVTIGINYLTLPRGRGQLSGCINDSDTITGLLTDVLGFQQSQIRRLRDDRSDMMPTKANILEAFRWLTEAAQPGDHLFLHYSGHGGQMEDRHGDEKDGKDETLMPCDFQRAGQITDDQLYAMLVANLPKGCRLMVVLDCCHSGTALDLRFKVQISRDGRSATLHKRHRRKLVGGGLAPEPTKADVIMLSGCKDNQTSADVSAGSLGTEAAAGAMTTALRHALTPTISCHKLLKNMRRFLKSNRFKQVPQMSSEQFVQLDSTFADYKAKRQAQSKRALDTIVAGIGPPSASDAQSFLQNGASMNTMNTIVGPTPQFNLF